MDGDATARCTGPLPETRAGRARCAAARAARAEHAGAARAGRPARRRLADVRAAEPPGRGRARATALSRRRRARAHRRRGPDPAHPRQVHPRPAAACGPATARGRPGRRRAARLGTTRCWRCSRCAAERGVAVVPFGGGTSVVGGLAPAGGGFAGVVALDLRRLDRLLAVDAGVAHGDPAGRACAARRPRRCSPSTASRSATSRSPSSTRPIGGFAATRSSGQSSAGYGRFDEHGGRR